MSNQRNKKRRRNSTASGGPRNYLGQARRLRLESVEGRLMLSTTGLDTLDLFAPLNVDAVQISAYSSLPASIHDDTSSTPPFHQGGFLDPTFPTVPRIQSINVPTPSPTIEDVLTGTESGLPTSTNYLDPGSSPVSTGSPGNFDLQPTVFPTWEPSLAAEPSLNSALARTHTDSANFNEGGAIQIESALTKVAALPDVDTSDQIAANLTSTTLDEPHSNSGSMGTEIEESGISGEWARGIVFEMAGGEPAAAARPARQDDSDTSTIHHATPPTTQVPVSSNAGTSSADGSLPENVAGSKQAHEANAPSSFLSALFRMFESGAFQTVGPNTPKTEQQNTAAVSPDNLGSHGSTLIGAAHEKALGELDAEEVAATSSLGLEFSWRGALNSTPLLMILALERIAASNSRRAQRRDALTSAMRPKLPKHPREAKAVL